MRLSKSSVVVLDRDGVINEDSADFIKTPAEWHALPGSLEAIARLHRAGITVVVATNQSGVGRGLFSVDTLWDIHRKMLGEVSEAGGYIVRIFFCLHAPHEDCDCRKPKPGLLYQAAEYLACGLENMIVIGDSARDLQSAVTVGATPILVRTGKGSATEKVLVDEEDFKDLEVYDDLSGAVDALLSEASQ